MQRTLWPSLQLAPGAMTLLSNLHTPMNCTREKQKRWLCLALFSFHRHLNHLLVHALALLFSTLTGLASAKTIQVTVGGPDKLLYDPEYVEADVGDYVRFNFQVKNHTATQSSFKNPCTALDDGKGFDSGFMPVGPDVTNFPYFDILVNDTKPIWAYCRQVNHCAQGMVFAVNPGNDFKDFKQNALDTANPATKSADYTTSYKPEPTVVPVTKVVTETDRVWTTTYGSYPGSAEPTWNAKPVEYTIVVGGAAGNVYTPSNIKANIGDTIKFQFQQKNHTVTQSSFNDPCRKLEFTSPGQIGFDSGFQPVAADVTANFPTWSIRVNDTAPIWAYCRQLTHCGQGMVFSANAPESGNTFDAFRANAIRINGTAATGTGSAGPGATGATSGALPLSGAGALGMLIAPLLALVMFA